MLSAGGDSYHRMLVELRQRDDYTSAFGRTLDQLAGRVDFSRVKSCVAFGTGSGEHELEFTARLLPNLSAFLAVEPDGESVEALRDKFRNCPPGFSAIKATVEEWNADGGGVDMALLFGVLFHVAPPDRRKLFHKLASGGLNPDGYVVIVTTDSESGQSGFVALMKVLGQPVCTYKDVEEDMLTAGFHPVLTVSITGTQDISNPSDDLVRLIQTVMKSEGREMEIRRATDEVFSRPEMRVFSRRLAVFQKK